MNKLKSITEKIYADKLDYKLKHSELWHKKMMKKVLE